MTTPRDPLALKKMLTFTITCRNTQLFFSLLYVCMYVSKYIKYFSYSFCYCSDFNLWTPLFFWVKSYVLLPVIFMYMLLLFFSCCYCIAALECGLSSMVILFYLWYFLVDVFFLVLTFFFAKRIAVTGMSFLHVCFYIWVTMGVWWG